MEHKKVLEIINLPGSAINFIGGQFKYLHEEGGYEMHLICSPGDNIEKFCVDNNVKYQPVLLERQIAVLKDITALIKICKYIIYNNIDIVIAHQAKARLLGMLACLFTGVDYRIIFAHGVLYETSHGLKRRMLILNDKFVSSIATKVVCVSQYVQKRRLDDGIDKPSKQILLGKGSCNGLDTLNKFNPALINLEDIKKLKEKYNIAENDYVIGFCGRLVKDKGIIELVDAFKTLVNNNPKTIFKLLIIGVPEIRDSIPQETKYYLTHSDNVIYTGKIPFAIIQRYYMLMDVLVLPSHREGFGMVAVEASAMEKPVLVSNYTGCAETIIPNVTGLYVNQSIKSIVEAMEKCLDENYKHYLGKNGRIFVSENFEHTKVRTHILELLNSLYQENGKQKKV